jgi:molybdate transport system regulatory protein
MAQPVLRVDFTPDGRMGRGKAQLLEGIRDSGSIAAAGKAMNMSYRRAWLLVQEMNRMFGQPVVEPQRGGRQGGGTVLTGFGQELLARFRQMEQAAAAAIAADLRWLADQRGRGGALSAPEE